MKIKREVRLTVRFSHQEMETLMTALARMSTDDTTPCTAQQCDYASNMFHSLDAIRHAQP